MSIYVKKDMDDLMPTDLGQYETAVGCMASDEQKELHDWVAAGNQTIDNPWHFAGEDGRPLDYITASRIVENMLCNPGDYGFGIDEGAMR